MYCHTILSECLLNRDVYLILGLQPGRVFHNEIFMGLYSWKKPAVCWSCLWQSIIYIHHTF